MIALAIAVLYLADAFLVWIIQLSKEAYCAA